MAGMQVMCEPTQSPHLVLLLTSLQAGLGSRHAASACKNVVLMSAAGVVSDQTNNLTCPRFRVCKVSVQCATYLLQALHQLLLLCTLGRHACCCLNSCWESCCWHVRAARQGTATAGELREGCLQWCCGCRGTLLAHQSCKAGHSNSR
jgi:hypothetical protein